MTLADPLALLLLPLIPALLYLRARLLNTRDAGTYSNLELVKGVRQTWRLRYRWIPTSLGAIAVALLLVALARPQSGRAESDISTEGVDIALVLDTSSSMRIGLTEGRTNLAEAQRVLKEFISGREDDRLALVIFRDSSLVLSPLTLDYGALSTLVEGVSEINLPDGTAIGSGLADGLNLLRYSRARSRVAILLTDGQNNSGSVEPLEAARIAETIGVRVYTIGLVSGQAGSPRPVTNVDERALQEIARVSGGLYFAAESREALEVIYANIDDLEQSRVEGLQFIVRNEAAAYFLVAALLLLMAELALKTTIWRQSA